MIFLTFIICAVYLLATFFRLFEKIQDKPMTWHGMVSFALGLLLHFVAVIEMIAHGSATQAFHVPLVLSTAGFVMASGCMLLEIQWKETIFSLFILPVVIPLVIISNFSGTFLQGPLYQGWLFMFHVFSSVAGECFFFFSSISGGIYLYVLRRLKKKHHMRAVKIFPPLTRLESLIAYFSLIGFIFFTLGLVAGGYWSMEAFGSIRFSESKRVLSFVVWTLFGTLLVSRKLGQLSGSKHAILAILGFLSSLALIFSGGTRMHWYP